MADVGGDSRGPLHWPVVAVATGSLDLPVGATCTDTAGSACRTSRRLRWPRVPWLCAAGLRSIGTFRQRASGGQLRRSAAVFRSNLAWAEIPDGRLRRVRGGAADFAPAVADPSSAEAEARQLAGFYLAWYGFHREFREEMARTRTRRR